MTQLGEGFTGRPIHVVFGNNDADLLRITRNAARFPHVQLHGAFYTDTFDRRSLAVNHYDDIALAIARGQTCDIVCYGHNHDFKIEAIGDTLAINPGAVLGYNPVHRADVPCTFVIYDTQTHLAQGYRIGESRGPSAKTGECCPTHDAPHLAHKPCLRFRVRKPCLHLLPSAHPRAPLIADMTPTPGTNPHPQRPYPTPWRSSIRPAYLGICLIDGTMADVRREAHFVCGVPPQCRPPAMTPRRRRLALTRSS
ncbi:MAG: metallophosphoesterase family protein [Anaerolineae bacterium]|nr:MAG: metallophosphoesterase family protein [Anaerolineae bacterium]